jgi:hypothetical protein
MRAGWVDHGGEAAVQRASVAREIASLAAAGGATLLLALSAGTAVAHAEETTFGGDPTQAITTEATCENAESPFLGDETCTWSWVRSGFGSDVAPLPELGGSGTVTSVTLPAMPNPGQMQVVVLTGALVASSNPSEPDSVCCKVPEVSPPFTVPANQIATVPLDLAVSAGPPVNLSEPGATQEGDGVGISVLTPGASLPILYTGNTLIGGPTPADRDKAYTPAITQPNPEFASPKDPTGFEVLAKFTLSTGAAAAPAPAPIPAPAPAPAAPAPPDQGLKLGGKTLTAAKLAGPLTIGQAQNPPTAATTQTFTVPGATAAIASHKKPKSKPKPIVVGKGSTTVPAGQTVALKLTLTSAGRKLLGKKHSLKVTETIVAKNSAGQTQTTTRTVTIRLKRK